MLNSKKKKEVSLISWNVNGIRAAYKKGLLDFIKEADADIYCFQETKAQKGQIPEQLKHVEGYCEFFASAVRRGYSGVCVYSRKKPAKVIYGTGIKKFDEEGRIIGLVFDDVLLWNIYFPNGGVSQERLDYKLEFYDHFLGRINKYRDSGRQLIFCGDVNTAHKEIDLARPKANRNSTGFLPEERAWIDKVIENGYIDIFRRFDNSPGKYTWWDYKTRARERNVGWRLDYFFISSGLEKYVCRAYIMEHITGSDHCPVALGLSPDVFK